jgi:sugar phosphate isomerase/epimerase
VFHIACHSWAYNNLSLAEAVGTIARLGFRYIDLGTGPHIDIARATSEPEATAENILLLLDDLNLTLTDLYLMLPHVNSPDPQRREQELGLFEKLVPFAVALGTPGITVSPGVLCSDGPDHSLARAIPALQHMMDVTEDTDFRVSFEPHLDSATSTPEQARLLLDAVPGSSLTLDVAHLVTQNARWDDLLQDTAHIHVRQAAADKLQVPLEQGQLDVPQLINDLVEADYHGALTVEYMTTFGWHGMMEVDISQEVTRMRDALREARQQYVPEAG